ncbi:hypothetical protein Bca52824_066010 [Brassica carinata]|uniref:Histone-binding protein RBBP4 N-terminal domain-containing protein n=1 Tax=Brassica carinata TaxID=52824 RepID=A0A8X7U9P6_BRACI|nr:hypothetical protein Bca52824_066010 [Brassica carinata]
MVAGTQVQKAPLNSIGLFKISNVSGKRCDVVPKTLVNGDDAMEDEDDEDEDSDSDEESEDGVSTTPVIQVRRVAHHGCVNCIRAMPQNPHICVSWEDSGHVQVWDMSSHLNALAESETEGKDGTSPALNQAPMVNFSGHKDEGYAIDWSPATAGRLLSGIFISKISAILRHMIHLWEPASCSWTVDPIPLTGHTASVEDLQVRLFQCVASCSVDGTIALWDVRVGKTLALAFKNRLASCMLASGSDDGAFSIHDLRVIKEGDAKIAHFEYHMHPITLIEWSKDEEEEAEFKAQTKEQVNTPQDLPSQLLFVHQIPGMIISTAEDGFNILMPYNIQNTLPVLAA